MMNVHTLTLGDYQTNTYLVTGDGKHCAVIDPGYEPETILNRAASLGLTVDAILLTHGHFDHVGAVEAIVKATGCKLWMHASDWSVPSDPMTHYFSPLTGNGLFVPSFCGEGDVICAGGASFAVLSTPGHTPGSVCYRCGDALFSGDTLFAGSCGRTDLPGGNWNTIQTSLHRLAQIQDNLTVYPGHGSATNLNRERNFNPYLR